MKIVKYLLLALLAIVVIGLIAAAFLPKEFKFEKSTDVNASADVVWQNALYFKNHDKWSQWRELDPNMKVNITGTDGEVGAKMIWESAVKDVGNGTQEIIKVDPGKRVDTKLNLGMGDAFSYMEVNGDSTKCKFTWGLTFKAPYPFNIFPALFAEKGMNQMFDRGFVLLKKASE